MTDINIKIKTKSKINDALLMIGVPFKKGAFLEGQRLQIFHNQNELPLWWNIRSYWPDGSIKWVFIHTRVPEGENTLVVKRITNKSSGVDEETNKEHKVIFDSNVLQVGDCALKVVKNKWVFKTSDGEWRLIQDCTDTDLNVPTLNSASGCTDSLVELLEESTIAPLIRIKPCDSNEGFITDHLLRIDTKGKRLIWTRRMTWNKEGKYTLKSSSAHLNIGSGINKANQNDNYNCKHGKLSTGSLLITEPGKVIINDFEIAEGYPEGRLDLKYYSLWVEKAWQRAPLGIKWKQQDIRLSFYPNEIRNLGVMGGTSFRHTIYLCIGEQAALVAGHEVEAIIDPDYICSTMALGMINAVRIDQIIEREDQINNFPGFEESFKATLDLGRLTTLADDKNTDGPAALLEDEISQDKAYFGLQHYGDWPMPWGSYGSRTVRMYASNEYDPAYAYYQGYAIYGDWRYMEAARQSAIHMTDVDFISYTGDLRFHGYNETAEDHEYARTNTGDYGHYWTDGFWMLYFLSGDIWAKEAAEKLTSYIMTRFLKGGEDFMRRLWSGGERSLGWPIVAAMGTFESTGDEELLKMIKKVVDFIDRFTSDPDREIEEEKGTAKNPITWWRTAMEDGCKPFMLGVIMEGLERYHRETGDPAAARSILNLARFIVDIMWLPHQATFIYEWNAFGRGHRMSRPHSLIPLFVRGIGYAYEISGEKIFMEVSEKAFHSCLWTLYNPESGGKSIGMIGRTLGAYVTMAEGWIKRDYERYVDSLRESQGKDFIWSYEKDGGIKKLLESEHIVQVQGITEYDGEALISAGESFIEARFAEPVYSDKGEVELRVKLNKDSTTWLNQRCYIHLCDDIHTKSCISILTFYTNLHARIYDNNRKLIEVAEGYIKNCDANGRPVIKADTPLWEEEEWHTVRVEWEAPGEIILYMDGIEADRRILDRPIGGSFTRVSIGHKPGNWRANGKIELIKLKCGNE